MVPPSEFLLHKNRSGLLLTGLVFFVILILLLIAADDLPGLARPPLFMTPPELSWSESFGLLSCFRSFLTLSSMPTLMLALLLVFSLLFFWVLLQSFSNCCRPKFPPSLAFNCMVLFWFTPEMLTLCVFFPSLFTYFFELFPPPGKNTCGLGFFLTSAPLFSGLPIVMPSPSPSIDVDLMLNFQW